MFVFCGLARGLWRLWRPWLHSSRSPLSNAIETSRNSHVKIIEGGTLATRSMVGSRGRESLEWREEEERVGVRASRVSACSHSAEVSEKMR